MSKFVRNQILLAKLESAYNTDPTPANGDAVAVSDFGWDLADAKVAERNTSTGSKLGAPSVFAGSLIELKFKVEIKGSGAAGTAPEVGPILQACGFLETIVASTSVAYKPDSDDEKSCTVYFDDDGDLFKVTGCRGNAQIVAEATKFGLLDITLRGHLAANPATSGGYTPTYDTTNPVPMLATPITIGAVALEQTKFTIDPANTIVAPAILNNADGFGEVRISARKTKFSMTVYPLDASSYNPVADLRANTQRALAMATAVGGTAGNRWRLTFGGNARYNTVKPGDDNGLVSYELGMEILESALGADNEFVLIYT